MGKPVAGAPQAAQFGARGPGQGFGLSGGQHPHTPGRLDTCEFALAGAGLASVHGGPVPGEEDALKGCAAVLVAERMPTALARVPDVAQAHEPREVGAGNDPLVGDEQVGGNSVFLAIGGEAYLLHFFGPFRREAGYAEGREPFPPQTPCHAQSLA